MGKYIYGNVKDVKKRIELNFQALEQMDNLWDSQLTFEEQLDFVVLQGLIYSEYVTGKYSSDFLEQKLYKISNTITIELDKNPKENEYLFVMTKAGNIGGHAVIANNWIQWDKNIKYSIVFTDFTAEDVPAFLNNAVKISGGKIFFLKGSYIEKAKQLLVISQNFSKVILLQHMYDIIPNLAYSNSCWNIPVFLYNHANFKFSFGYEVADIVINLMQYDVIKTINFRGTDSNKSKLLQFPNGGRIVDKIENSEGNACKAYFDKDAVIRKYEIDSRKKLVLSIGESFKFHEAIDCNFFKFAERLIECRKGDTQYIIVGPNPNEEKWKDLDHKTSGLVKSVGYLNRSDIDDLVRICDLYIVSFPMSSFGAAIAEEYEIPYLMLSITGRGVENYGANIVSTVDELLQKSNEILDGNIESYKGTYYKKILNQEQWCHEWHKIADSITVHTGQQIHPKRLIQTEEIVNCQLMQEKASENVKKILSQLRLTPNIMRMLIDVNEKYQLDCIPEQFSIFECGIDQGQSLLQQKMNLLSYTNKWLNLKIKGYKITDYFCKQGITDIAIYGMGQIGLNLLEELKYSSIEVECFIDRNAQKLNAPIKIIGLYEVPVRSRVIVTTAWIEEEQLRKDYTCLTDEYQIISLFDVIDTLGKGD